MLITRPGDPDAAFARIDLAHRRAVTVALSGGSDSTALLVLLHQWLRCNRPDTALVAVTVDHALRPQSAAEAVQMADFCAGLGIRHCIRQWEGEKPATGISAAAREARYRLLAESASKAGTDLILTAHTAEDQAETVFMRRARGGGSGLAGMAASTLYRGETWIVRPLLRCRRKALRQELRLRNLGWIEDPTNADPRYERVRVRQALRDEEKLAAMLALAAEHGQRRIEQAREVARWLAKSARLAAPGLIECEAVALEGGATATRALRLLLACIGGSAHLPGEKETLRVQEELRAGRKVTLARTLLTPRCDKVLMHRELRDLPERDEDGIYDGRRRLVRLAVAQGWRLMRQQAAGTGIAQAAAAGEPVPMTLRGKENRRAAVEPVLAPFDHFLPGFDLEAANALARLFGRRRYPAAPLAEDDSVP